MKKILLFVMLGFGAGCFCGCEEKRVVETDLVAGEWMTFGSPELPLEEAINLYGDWAGKVVRLAPEFSDQEIHFVQKGPFTKEEGARLLELTLRLNGYALEKGGGGVLEVKKIPFELTGNQAERAKKRPIFDDEEVEAVAEKEELGFSVTTQEQVAELMDEFGKKRILVGEDRFKGMGFRLTGPATRGMALDLIWQSVSDAGYGLAPVDGNDDVLLLVVMDEEKVKERNNKKTMVPRDGQRVRYIPKPR
jgi:hypothetical protein